MIMMVNMLLMMLMMMTTKRGEYHAKGGTTVQSLLLATLHGVLYPKTSGVRTMDSLCR